MCQYEKTYAIRGIMAVDMILRQRKSANRPSVYVCVCMQKGSQASRSALNGVRLSASILTEWNLTSENISHETLHPGE